MTQGIKDKVVVITGASSGLGEATGAGSKAQMVDNPFRGGVGCHTELTGFAAGCGS